MVLLTLNCQLRHIWGFTSQGASVGLHKRTSGKNGVRGWLKSCKYTHIGEDKGDGREGGCGGFWTGRDVQVIGATGVFYERKDRLRQSLFGQKTKRKVV